MPTQQPPTRRQRTLHGELTTRDLRVAVYVSRADRLDVHLDFAGAMVHALVHLSPEQGRELAELLAKAAAEAAPDGG